MKTRLLAGTVLVTGIALGLGAGRWLRDPSPTARAADEAATARERIAETADLAQKLESIFQNAATAAGESVVSIKAEKTAETPREQAPSNPFEDFFRDPFGTPFGAPGQPRRQPRRAQGQGSGTILDKEGHVLTNNHVVSGATKLRVEMADGRSFDAKLIGTDSATDLAVIKIQDSPDDLPVARLGNSDDLKIGQWVLALGNPFGLAHTVSAGIVSAKGRSGIGMADYENWIQTDAAVNPGNSGGPLVNLRGEVVGINVAILSRTGGSVGIGFAIPVNVAKSVLADLKAGKKVTRGYLGVVIEDLNEARAEMFDYEGTDGVFVREVNPGTPADEAEIEAGDIIMQYDGKPVTTVADLRIRVAATKPGTKVALKVWREGKEVPLELKLGDLAEAVVAEAPDWLGLTVQTLSPAMARNMGKAGLEGVLVAEVATDGLAAGLIQPGEVILSVNRRKVTTQEEFNNLVSKLTPERGALFRVMNGATKRMRFVMLRAGGE